MVPNSLSIWIQRAGRCGRAGQESNAYLLVQPSVYQLKKKAIRKKKTRTQQVPPEHAVPERMECDHSTGAAAELEVEADTDDEGGNDVEFAKKVEEGLRTYIETELCRRKVADQYFNNPKRNHGEMCSLFAKIRDHSLNVQQSPHPLL